MFRWFKKKLFFLDLNVFVFWKVYLESLVVVAYDKRMLIEEIGFVVFDIEIIGLDVQEDQIFFIGVVWVKNWQISVEDCLECYIYQEYYLDGKIVVVYGILLGEKLYSIVELEGVCCFLEFVGGDVLVVYYVVFDVVMFNVVIYLVGGGKLQNIVLDMGVLACRVVWNFQLVCFGIFGFDYFCDIYWIF